MTSWYNNILFHAPPNTGLRHKAFLRCVQAQSHDTAGEHKNASGIVGIPYKRAPQATCDKSSPTQVG